MPHDLDAPAHEVDASPPAPPAPVRHPLIELGWVLVGRIEAPDRQAIERARERMLATLEETFPGFTWRMPVVEREAPVARAKDSIVGLLDQGAVERQAKRWDFALVVTGADLDSFYKPFALGAPARSMSVAVVSTIRVDPHASGRGRAEGERVEIMTQRLYALGLHLFGHLNGLEHTDEPDHLMFDVKAVADLDRMERFSPEHVERLAGELGDVADVRLEEQEGGARRSRLSFYLRTMRHNWDDIAGAVRHARPWEFPLRFSRLTAAAFSALVVLVITAEAWDLGMSQGRAFVAAFSVVTVGITCTYILRRQQLLVRRETSRPSELTAVTNVSMVITVLFGMVTTYIMLFSVTLLLSQLFFSPHLVAGWAASLDGRVRPVHYLVFAAFVASLGLLIGALGASFEQQTYFRHVASVDEET